MKIKFSIFLSIFSFFYLSGTAQIPAGYYDNAVGKQHRELKESLYEIIKNNSLLEYTNLWNYFAITDLKDNGKVWDMYSDLPDTIPPYEFTFNTDRCGSEGYTQEGDCYNREHSVPNSWFGEKQYPMYSDLFHIYPVDGWVNNKRNNYPYGNVSNPTWTSKNGSKLGTSASEGYNGIVFEPIDAYKGDLARSYFYMCVRYKDINFSQNEFSQFNGAELAPWALNQLVEWHLNDPVSQKEIDRNNNVYSIQNNRNPFIDYPELVGYLWGDDTTQVFAPYVISTIKQLTERTVTIYPNPAHNQVTISTTTPKNSVEIQILDMVGKVVLNYYQEKIDKTLLLNIETLPPGIYALSIAEKEKREIHKLIVW